MIVESGKEYCTVITTVRGRQLRYVHALVAATFIGPRPEGLEVAHGDGNRKNNRPDNLRYATSFENAADRLRHGTLNVGSLNGGSRLTPEQASEISRLKGSASASKIAHRFGVSRMTILRIWAGTAWRSLPVPPLKRLVESAPDSLLSRVLIQVTRAGHTAADDMVRASSLIDEALRSVA